MELREDRIWCEPYKIISPLVNHRGVLGLYGTLNLLQETAWMHARSAGFGLQEMSKENLIWVYTRQTLEMIHWPHYGDEIQIQTWVRPPEGVFVTRNFLITDKQGQPLGSSSASFLALDRTTRKIIPSLNLRPWDQITNAKSLPYEAEKIPVAGEAFEVAKYRVRNSDLDFNQHVNNTKYAQWILDAIPLPVHESVILKRYNVNFLAETHLGDKVQVFRQGDSHDSMTSNEGVTTYKGLRHSDEKVLFTAKLTWEKC